MIGFSTAGNGRADFLAVAGLRYAAAVFAVLVLAWTVPAAAQRFDQGLLWRIEGGGVPASHVFGTIHVSDKRVTQLPPAVSRALGEARGLIIEIGFDPANIVALASRMVFLDGRNLAGAVGQELYDRTAVITGQLGIPDAALQMFKPWAIALLLSVPHQNPEEVLDHVLSSAARAQGKAVYELETVDEQVAVFDGMEDADQVVLLRRAVENYSQLRATIDRVISAYLARDLAAMSRIAEELAGGSADLQRLNRIVTRRMLDDRNSRMAERLHAPLKEGGAFVALGALHLHGERGVLAELERRGWRVSRVY